MMRVVVLSLICFWGWNSAAVAEDIHANYEKSLQAGNLAEAEAVLAAELTARPGNSQARYALGTVQFLRTLEAFSQSMYRHGVMQQPRRLLGNGGLFNGLELPIPDNPKPEKINYAQSRQIVQKLVTGLGQAEATLAAIHDDQVKLPVHVGMIRLDLNGDGVANADETWWKLFKSMNPQVRLSEADASDFVIVFDAGDALWLRGYCHLMMGVGEGVLAHDWKEFFERVGHVMFPVVESPYPFLTEGREKDEQWWSPNNIMDLIAYIHLLNFPVTAPERMQVALQHFEQVTELSQKSWDLIEKETDNDREWLPNPKQTGVIPGVRVTAEMIGTWREVMKVTRSILDGKTLIPFWRGSPKRGINVRLFFTQPRDFDVVLWIQGTGAAPYLQEGQISDPGIWSRAQRIFGGQFAGFAFWFN